MKNKIIQIFFLSSAFLLLVTAAAKLVSSAGSAPILNQKEFIFKVSYRHLFWLVGGCELAVAAACIFVKTIKWRAALLACLATYFLIYRFSLHWLGVHYCSCLGSLTEMLPFSKRAINLSLISVLTYFLLGSYAILLDMWVEGGGLPQESPAGAGSISGNQPDMLPDEPGQTPGHAM